MPILNLKGLSAAPAHIGDLVPPSEAAIVTTGGMAELQMLVPDHAGDGEMMPAVMIFLLAVFMRARDPEFVAQQLAWFDQFEAEIESRLSGSHQ
jgi:hypothetical protein